MSEIERLRSVPPQENETHSRYNWSTHGFPGSDPGGVAASKQVSADLDARSEPYRILPLLPGFREVLV